ncbi:electron transfer flavoprotein subunit alpha/FixB family protein [Glutamicibacter creatinolyticus]|uniref:electron transfer flavoprotein subunit alpha/FixB family protein n=1 Tax=Glutamicibacter TaxID=1742989 RepID=UPI0010FCE1CA|nr:electron transfer flavoprotein subunit alpha/FixB family protein [Glutamicibacter sp. V16R2B1]TLK51193.1 electron transfer flavoprotein subunit alpha/FixB family protein [Glutamicibacter sp. V16R2B1]
MTSALVFFDALGQEPTKAQRELLTLATRFSPATVAVVGEVSAPALEVLAGYGITSVLQAPAADSFQDHEVAALEAAISSVNPELVLLANDSFNREVAARAAIRCNGGVITDAVDVAGDGTVTKDELAGSYTTQANAASGVLLVTVKPNSIEDAPAGAGQQPQVQDLQVAAANSAVQVVERQAKVSTGRPALSEARIVVAGGRGVDGDFAPIEELADALGAAVGASRAATDAGWIDHDYQVGQTGTTVSPQLYISVGISGAIQQKAGMQTSKYIVAVNKDEDAPIFEIADFGIIGDLRQVLPQAAEEIRRRKS